MDQIPSRRRSAVIILVGGYVGIIVSVLEGLLLVPLYLRFVGPRLYGAWIGTGDVMAWLAVLDMGLASVMIQRIANAYGRNDMPLVGKYLGTGLLSQLSMSLLLMLGAGSLSVVLPKWMALHAEEAITLSGCFFLSSIAVGLAILNNGIAGLAMALQRPVIMSIMTPATGVMGIALTLLLLYGGWGLWAISTSLVVRNAILCLSNGAYGVWLLHAVVREPVKLDRTVLRELVCVSPALLVGKLGSALLSRSDAALVAFLLRPESATLLVLSRRSSDIARMLLDRIAGAVYGPLASIIGESRMDRARAVLLEVAELLSAGSALLFGGCLLLNHSFVQLWVGPEQFGGQLLTFLLVAAVMVGTRNNMLNYLYGASGELVRGPYVSAAEAAVRIPLSIGLLRVFGIAGSPAACIMTGVIANHILVRWMGTKFQLVREQSRKIGLFRTWAEVVVVVASACAGHFVQVTTWPALIAAVVVYGFVAFCFLGAVNPAASRQICTFLRRGALVLLC